MATREYKYFSKPLYSTIQFWVSMLFFLTAVSSEWSVLKLFRSKYTLTSDIYLSMIATLALLIVSLVLIALQHGKMRRALKETGGELADSEVVVAAFEVVRVFYMASACVFLSMTVQMLLFGHAR